MCLLENNLKKLDKSILLTSHMALHALYAPNASHAQLSSVRPGNKRNVEMCDSSQEMVE
jgi:hypothetical protein